MKPNSTLYALALVLILVASTACSPFGWFVITGSSRQAPTPEISGIMAPPATLTSTSAPIPSTPAAPQTRAPAPTSTPAPGSQGPLPGWKTFTSTLYQYAVSYPSDWTVSVETPKSSGRTKNVERVPFKQPNYGVRNQFTTIMIEANRGESWTFVTCDSKITVSGISACRNSMPAGQNPAQEIVYFQKGDSSFVLQLAYEDKKYVDVFNRMVANFKFTSSAEWMPSAPGQQSLIFQRASLTCTPVNCLASGS